MFVSPKTIEQKPVKLQTHEVEYKRGGTRVRTPWPNRMWLRPDLRIQREII